MEGFIFQFPDFDDPAINGSQINFDDPNGFYAEYNKPAFPKYRRYSVRREGDSAIRIMKL